MQVRQHAQHFHGTEHLPQSRASCTARAAACSAQLCRTAKLAASSRRRRGGRACEAPRCRSSCGRAHGCGSACQPYLLQPAGIACTAVHPGGSSGLACAPGPPCGPSAPAALGGPAAASAPPSTVSGAAAAGAASAAAAASAPAGSEGPATAGGGASAGAGGPDTMMRLPSGMRACSSACEPPAAQAANTRTCTQAARVG